MRAKAGTRRARQVSMGDHQMFTTITHELSAVGGGLDFRRMSRAGVDNMPRGATGGAVAGAFAGSAIGAAAAGVGAIPGLAMGMTLGGWAGAAGGYLSGAGVDFVRQL